MKIALVTGITGQDGSYLSELLIKKGYKVHGIIRRSSSFNTGRIDHLFNNKKLKNKFFLHYGDLLDGQSLSNVISKIKPNVIYNLAAQSHVSVSYELPEYTLNVDAIGTLKLLEIIKSTNKKIKFYQASSSEIFGKNTYKTQNEITPMIPSSPYGIAKLCSYLLVKMYRESYGMFCSNGILFNHESPRRGGTFVTKKIIQNLVRRKHGSKEFLSLGNIYSIRDWGYAPDYVEGMYKIMQYKKPDDFVLSTNTTCSIKEFVNLSMNYLGIKYKWIGKGFKEKAICPENGNTIVKIDKKYFRPIDVSYLNGDYKKALKAIGWKPKTKLKELIKIMIKEEINSKNK